MLRGWGETSIQGGVQERELHQKGNPGGRINMVLPRPLEVGMALKKMKTQRYGRAVLPVPDGEGRGS